MSRTPFPMPTVVGNGCACEDCGCSRPTPNPDGPFAQPPDQAALPEYDWKGLGPDPSIRLLDGFWLTWYRAKAACYTALHAVIRAK